MTIRIIIADDHRVLREGLASLAEQNEDLTVVDQAESGREAIELCKEHRPDVVLMDVAMPDLNGVLATQKIIDQCPGVKVIALSSYSDQEYVGEMMEAGAMGYLLKDCAFEEVESAIRSVTDGQTYLSPGVAEVVVQNYVRKVPSPRSPGSAQLSPRETEVLQLITEGKSSKEIGRILDVSVKTVGTHRRRIMDKLEMDSIAELTKYAVRRGITSLDD